MFNYEYMLVLKINKRNAFNRLNICVTYVHVNSTTEILKTCL